MRVLEDQYEGDNVPDTQQLVLMLSPSVKPAFAEQRRVPCQGGCTGSHAAVHPSVGSKLQS